MDGLEEEDDRISRAEARLDEKLESIREAARERGRRQLPQLLRKAESIFSCRGYFPQDAKALFDPVDFIIFDGMNRKKRVDRVVLFDGPADDRDRERVQDSVQRTVRSGNYEWKTIRIGKNGQIQGT